MLQLDRVSELITSNEYSILFTYLIEIYIKNRKGV